MMTPTEKISNYFNSLMQMADKNTNSSEDHVLLAGAMMAVAKMLYHDNLSEKEYDEIMNHNSRDLLNLLKPTIH
jgi:hypothetical protein|tara:strand:+ start:1398 stop:1619 length:222 start_codon:yes stop_codon:yes gene_type:complete